MPGLIGVIGEVASETQDRLLDNMAQALKHEDWYKVHLYSDEGVGLGRVSVGVLNPEPQPIWNEDHTLCIVMEGEVYDYGDEKRRLIERGYEFRMDNDPEYVLYLYEEYGEDFVSKLNGAFVAAIWDARRRKLIVANDHMGLRPLYYTQVDGVLLFAAGVRSLLSHPGLSRQIDVVSMAQLLTFEHVLGNRTLLTDVHLLPPACVLVYEDGRLSIRHYWVLQYTSTHEPRSEGDFFQEYLARMERAFRRQKPNEAIPSAVSLSGGTDSRVVLAQLMDVAPDEQIHTFTFGLPGSDDHRFARDISRAMGVTNHFFELTPDFLLTSGPEGVQLTDGMKSCAHMHMLANIRKEGQYARLIYIGYPGDSLMGRFLIRNFWGNYTPHDLANFIIEKESVVFKTAEHEGLFAPDHYALVSEAVADTFRSALNESTSELAADRYNRFILRHLKRRFQVMGHELVRSQVALRTPFADRELVEFMLSVPPGFRLDRYLFMRALTEVFVPVAKVPRTGTGQPFVPCFRDLRFRVSNQVGWRLRAAGLKWAPVFESKHYADYGGWMRTALRPWVEDTLLSKRALERGYFKPAFIRNLVAEHIAGANHTFKLGILLTLELWHRQFID
jgi:asparagine synthase (glutamine-hydrolysing)